MNIVDKIESKTKAFNVEWLLDKEDLLRDDINHNIWKYICLQLKATDFIQIDLTINEKFAMKLIKIIELLDKKQIFVNEYEKMNEKLEHYIIDNVNFIININGKFADQQEKRSNQQPITIFIKPAESIAFVNSIMGMNIKKLATK